MSWSELDTVCQEIDDELTVSSFITEQLQEVVLIERVDEHRPTKIHVLIISL